MSFPFTTEQVINLLGLNPVTKNSRSGKSGYFYCPHCGGKRLNVNYEKGTFFCFNCDEKGHTDKGSLLGFYRSLNPQLTDNKEAFKDICDKLSLPQYYKKAKKTYRSSDKKNNCSIYRASNNETDKTYRALLNLLGLSESHRNSLLERGFTPEQIEKFMFRSTPIFGTKFLASKLYQQGFVLKGIAGFFKENKKWNVNFNTTSTGIIVPMFNEKSCILGLQIRLDKPFKDGRKYLWFSSTNKENGISAGSPVCWVGSSEPADTNKVFVTEGPIKAMLTSCRTGYTVIGKAGVNNNECLRHSFNVLKANNTKAIYDICDCDCNGCKNKKDGCNNTCKKIKNVEQGRNSLKKLIEEYDFEPHRLSWDKYKGVDDLVVGENLKDLHSLHLMY